jgi:hypothetical protein
VSASVATTPRTMRSGRGRISTSLAKGPTDQREPIREDFAPLRL